MLLPHALHHPSESLKDSSSDILIPQTSCLKPLKDYFIFIYSYFVRQQNKCTLQMWYALF